jgi:hypothetical protein
MFNYEIWDLVRDVDLVGCCEVELEKEKELDGMEQIRD